MDEGAEIIVERNEAIANIASEDWDALVGDGDPFIEHAFLAELERSESVGPPETGWVPCHLTARRKGRLVGAMPLYKKTHSYGEYIFDWAWAQASHRAGVPYYPKLVSAVPFSPVTGRRLLIADGEDEVAVIAALAEALGEAAEELGCWSVHVLFCTEEERVALGAAGLLERETHQYHWHRKPEWGCFEDYLCAMRSRARKEIRRERRLARDSGLRFEWRTGEQTTSEDWAAMWRFYSDTTDRKYGSAYLNEAFFCGLRDRLKHRAHLALAYDGETPQAGALFLEKGDRLIGRYWGTSGCAPHVHFELCYYMPLERCLERGLQRFEAGAQGEHKIRRGLMPRTTHSASWFRVPGLSEAVGGYLQEERAALEREMAWLEERGPFKEPTSEPG